MSDAPEPTCAYCGLPVPRPWWSRARPSSNGEYCCFGCRFAAEVTQARGEEGASRWALTRLGVAVFLTMNVMVFTMALWAQDGGDAGPLVLVLRGLFRYLCLLFALPVLLLLGAPLLEDAWDGLQRGRPTSDLLLTLGIAASYLYSALSVVRDEGEVYFEVGCMVLVLVTLGRWLDAQGKLKASAAIEALHRLLPDQARLVRAGREVLVPLADVVPGDRLHVLPGERIPCDGVAHGTAALDEQLWTGESQPAVKELGDHLIAGTLNLEGDVFLTVTAPATESALARLVALVRQARQAKGRHERFADQVAAWFTPFVVLVALSAAAWQGSLRGPEAAIRAGLAVLVIACPCALGLATPMAVWTALGRLANDGVLFRNGEALERLAGIRAVRLDKTGTLTTGTPTVAAFTAVTRGDRDGVLRVAARLALASTHWYARAICQFAEQEGLAPAASAEQSPEVRTLPGRGLTAQGIAPNQIWLGSPRLMDEAGLAWGADLAAVRQVVAQAGQPVAAVGWDGSVRGVFLFREELRAEAAEAVGQLRALGLHVGVLTGDGAGRGAQLAHKLGLPVEANLLPEDKVAALVAARAANGPVAMVGDGINDAPALAASDVGIALGCGADVARDSAAVCLLGNDLRGLPWAIDLSRRTVHVIRQNLFWAFVYNTAGIALACTGRLNPIIAALAMVLSSSLVVGNSLRLGALAREGPRRAEAGPGARCTLIREESLP